jgi:hypothetical protein
MARHPLNLRSGKLSELAPALSAYLAEGGELERGKGALAAEIWPQIVGHWYARHSQVVALKKKELQVYCDTPALAQQMQYDQETILERLNTRLGGQYITKLRPSSVGPRRQREVVRAQRELHADGPSDEELAQVPVPEEELQAIHAAAAAMDEGLRAGFRRYAEYWLRLEEWKRRRGYRECPDCRCLHDELEPLCYACRTMRSQPYLE